jgi:hypothetical protein
MINWPFLELLSKVEIAILMDKSLTREDIQAFVDVTYSSFTDSLYAICEKFLPVYDPVEIKSKPDNSIVLDGKCSNTSTIRAFKRSQRAFSVQKNIKPRNSSRSIEDESFSHYKALYCTTTHPPPVCPSLSNFTNVKRVFTTEVIKKAIKYYPSAKSGGPDNFSVDFFKCLGHSNTFSDILGQLFQFFYRVGITPTDWNQSKLFLLIKDIKEPYADKTRPIALTNILRRFFEKAILQDMLGQPWSKLHVSQAGFKKGWSTVSHILLSDEMSKSGYPISIFLDLKSAFDAVCHKQLLDVLTERGCPDREKNLIFSLMISNCVSFLIVNGNQIATPIERNQGVFQGSVLSPFLFNIFIDKLAQKINSLFKIPVVLFFADDINIKARTYEEGQSLINICLEWSRSHYMTWGISKCGSVGSKRSFMLQGQPIPMVKNYKYLGVPHAANNVLYVKNIKLIPL